MIQTSYFERDLVKLWPNMISKATAIIAKFVMK